MATIEVRSEFKTREGIYKNIRTSQYCRPSRQPLAGKELQPVRLSFVSCKDQGGRLQEWIVFNAGKELYVYRFEGVGKPPDLRRHVDKKLYRLPCVPLCHDFNIMTRSVSSLDLIVGFSTGQIHYINPIQKSTSPIFNENFEIEESPVTCIKWVPGTENQFVSSHRSGHLYVWTTENVNKSVAPQMYIQHNEIQDTVIFTPKPRHRSPLIFKWKVGYGAISSFAFSPDSTHLAIVNQDGFLRVYDFKNQTFHGRMRSYYGSLLCVCWSPDGEYVATGGEDDQISVWSFRHQCVVVRGEGHKSYVNAIAFDPFTSVIPDKPPTRGEDDTNLQCSSDPIPPQAIKSHGSPTADGMASHCSIAYRLGSVGQDGMICLWDLSDDVLRLRRLHSRGRSRLSKLIHSGSQPSSPVAQRKCDEGTDQEAGQTQGGGTIPEATEKIVGNGVADLGRASPKSDGVDEGVVATDTNMEASRKPPASAERSTPSRSNNPQSNPESGRSEGTAEEDEEEIGQAAQDQRAAQQCHEVGTFETCKSDDVAPKMHEVNVIEPLVAKYVSQERLTELIFLDDCIITCSQEGFVDTWARPDTPLPKQYTNTTVAGTESTTPPRNPPGLNSPRPGEEDESLKQTTV
eukprot:Em0019g94a